MKSTRNMFHVYFDSVYTLEGYLRETNFKLTTLQDKQELLQVLTHLSSVVVAFDFEFKGRYTMYIDKRTSYEQILLLCYLNIRDNKTKFNTHMLIDTSRPSFGKIANTNIKFESINLPREQLCKKLIDLNNNTLGYFLSLNEFDDGIYWRRLHTLIGSSLFKYLIIYAYMFRRVDNVHNSHVQICGPRFNVACKKLLAKRLDSQKAMNWIDLESKTHKRIGQVFEEKERQIKEQENEKNEIGYQLKKLANVQLNKTIMLYSRNLSFNMSSYFIYSDKKLKATSETAERIVNEFIFKKVTFTAYTQHDDDIKTMKSQLANILVPIIENIRSCPYAVFLDYFCCVKSPPKVINLERTKSQKRNRDQKDKITPPAAATLKDFVESNRICGFLRRCLIYILEVDMKKVKPNSKSNYDRSCALLGGQVNFLCLAKKISKIVKGMKYDSFILNDIVHGLKLARISYLKPIKCHRFKLIILISVVRWLLEDVAFIVLKSQFFITDTNRTNSQIFFYMKKNWKQIMQTQLNDPVTKPFRNIYHLQKVTESNAYLYTSRWESQGFTLGRLFPKSVDSGCRLISGCRIFNPYTQRAFTGNYAYVTLNCALKWLIANDPSLVGFACNGHAQIRNKYLSFLNLNSMYRSFSFDDDIECDQSIKKWNFAKIDIQKCFDSIDIKVLSSLIVSLLTKELKSGYCFTLMRFCSVRLEVDRIHSKIKYDYQTIKHKTTQNGYKYGIADFIRHINQESNSTNNSPNKNIDDQLEKADNIIVPLGIHERDVELSMLKKCLNKCLQHVMIKIHHQIYERINGIAQGSVCSRNFCDLYLGKIENDLFSFQREDAIQFTSDKMILSKSNELIIRVVDDYLLVCSDINRLNEIYNRLRSKIPLNVDKTEIKEWHKCEPKIKKPILTQNFQIQTQMTQGSQQRLNELSENIDFLSNCSQQYFSWCGFDFDRQTLDVYLNYTKYFNNMNIHSRLNIYNDYKYPFAQFNMRFLRLFDTNSSSLVIDCRVNNIQAILRNFVDFYSMSVIRFCLYYPQMPSQIKNNLNLQFKLIENLSVLACQKVNFQFHEIIKAYFKSSYRLFSFISLKVYSKLFGYLKIPRHNALKNLVDNRLMHSNFNTNTKRNDFKIIIQLNDLIDEQIGKFYQVDLRPAKLIKQ